jgi:hypothetical protein
MIMDASLLSRIGSNCGVVLSALVDPDSQDNYRYATDYGVYLADHLALIQVSRERKAAAKVIIDQLNSGKLNATSKERF